MPKNPARARKQRKETQLLLTESQWLQKASFALGKVRDARAKLAESRGTELAPLSIGTDTHAVALTDVHAAFAERVDQLRNRIGERRYRFR